MAERRTRRSETIYHSVYNMNAGLYKYFLDQKFCINLSVYAILNKRRNLTTITNNNLSRIEENNKTPYQGACLNLIYKFDFGKKVKVKRAKSIQTTSDSSIYPTDSFSTHLNHTSRYNEGIISFKSFISALLAEYK